MRERTGERDASLSAYSVLGVEPGCSATELEAAFLAKVKQFHTDVNRDGKNSDTMIRRVIQAYELQMLTNYNCSERPSRVETAVDAKDELEAEKTTEELVEETTTSMDEDSALGSKNQESPTQGPMLPMLQKVVSLSSQIQRLKKEHAVLCDEATTVKNCFPGPEFLESLRHLGTKYENLKKKYLEESSERKRLYNEVIELRGNIRVFCRCRPLSQVEVANGSRSVVEFDTSQDNELQIVSTDSSKKQFKFDHVFRPEDDQEAVFAETWPIVTSVLDGYNVCIFAYGQTGTGKTFTMEGTSDNRGVNYRALEELFRLAHRRSNVMRYAIFVSMLEVYNEKIRDLLVESSNQPPKRLEIKQAAEGAQEVPGLVEACVSGTEDVWELLKTGSQARSVGSTGGNELSSRSHCLLRVTVKGESLIDGHRTKSHLWLVDLAGSERVGKIEVEGERLKESQFINKSLSALGDVISALASKTGHIPYRNSKLTHMLQSSLGGDCKTLMFVQISPSEHDLGETLCSLNFASRVRGVEGGPARKQTDLTELNKYKQLAEKLKHDEKETKKLQDLVQSLQLKLAAKDHVCRSLQGKVRDLENQLGDERKTRLKQENRASAVVKHLAAERTKAEKKPPLAPSKFRPPLRRITNFVHPPSPKRSRKTIGNSASLPLSTFTHDKENIFRTITAPGTSLLQPRRASIAIKPSQAASKQVLPKRRVSMATLCPESSTTITTPLHTSASQLQFCNAMGQQSLIPRKAARYSALFSPLPEFKTTSEIATPTAMRSSSKFMGSPPTQAGSWKPKHPTVLALQRKSLVWSPLKLRSMKGYRKTSLLPVIIK